MAALHTEQLEFLVTHLAQLPGYTEAVGVFAADRLPVAVLHRDHDACFILNTDPSNAPGAHWLAFYYDSSKRCLEYFDSFGLPLSLHYDVSESLSRRGLLTHVVAMNNLGMLQSPSSTACGYYCILYLHYRSLYHRSGAHAVRKIAKLARTATKRDAAVVRCVHSLMHQHHCSDMPINLLHACRDSQSCECHDAHRRR